MFYRPTARVAIPPLGALAVALALGALAGLAGCAASEITTRRGLEGTTDTLKGTTYVLKASGNASVTSPDVPRYAEAAAFLRSQRERVARQAAAGGGEDIDALAFLLAKPDSAAVAHAMQSNYVFLFSDRTVSASTVIARIDALTI